MRIVGIEVIGGFEMLAGLLPIPSQIVVVAVVVVDSNRVTELLDDHTVSALSQIEAAQPIVASRKADPGLLVGRIGFNGTAVMLLRQTVIFIPKVQFSRL